MVLDRVPKLPTTLIVSTHFNKVSGVAEVDRLVITSNVEVNVPSLQLMGSLNCIASLNLVRVEVDITNGFVVSKGFILML